MLRILKFLWSYVQTSPTKKFMVVFGMKNFGLQKNVVNFFLAILVIKCSKVSQKRKKKIMACIGL